ncbi:MAG: hypothetical protein E5X15_26525 [Mesorhizobium sp.]|nr:MAG: hypothetical protein E5X15_26525 [Mesorhizobium sp.]
MNAAAKSKPAAWQRYGDRTGWTAVDEDYAQYLAANGVKVRPLFAETCVPDLIAALEAIRDMPVMDRLAVYEIAKAAIAKATA